MPDKADRARKLQAVRQDLETQLNEAIQPYDWQLKGPMEFSLTPEEGGTPDEQDMSKQERELRETVRTLVDEFHQTPVVRETGVHIDRITAIDSDADGAFALEVEYDYRIDTEEEGPEMHLRF